MKFILKALVRLFTFIGIIVTSPLWILLGILAAFYYLFGCFDFYGKDADIESDCPYEICKADPIDDTVVVNKGEQINETVVKDDCKEGCGINETVVKDA